MLPITDDLQNGIATARAGNKEQARAFLLKAVKAEPRNETAWLWLSYCMPTTEQARRCIDHLLTINPTHAKANEAREVLQVRLLLEEAAVLRTPTPPPSTPQRRYLLGEALIEARIITPQQLQTALAEQDRLARKRKPKRLGEILLQLKMVRPEQLEGAVATQIESLPSSQAHGATGLLGEFLLSKNLITRAQLHQGLAQQAELRRQGKAVLLGDMLVQCGYLQRDQLNRAMVEWQQQYEEWYR